MNIRPQHLFSIDGRVWVALSVYLLLAILKKQLGLDLSLYTITQILSVTLFEKTTILQVFQAPLLEANQPDPSTQLILFN